MAAESLRQSITTQTLLAIMQRQDLEQEKRWQRGQSHAVSGGSQEPGVASTSREETTQRYLVTQLFVVLSTSTSA